MEDLVKNVFVIAREIHKRENGLTYYEALDIAVKIQQNRILSDALKNDL